jgi:hypothetical protein
MHCDTMLLKIQIPIGKYSKVCQEEQGDIFPILIPPPFQKEQDPHG